MKQAIITTTINVPDNLREWREILPDDPIIIAGDIKTPHKNVQRLCDEMPGTNIYLHPDDQKHWLVSERLGWNCVQRRNIATLSAISLGVDRILTLDDDNYPTASWVNHEERVGRVIVTNTRWYNPGVLCQPSVVHRGFPLDQWHTEHQTLTINRVPYNSPRIGVWASMWVGDPDVSAIERISRDPMIENVDDSVILGPGTWAPFNTQSTIIRSELAPLLFVWPGVGRYDDIWCSYLARAVMDLHDYGVWYGWPIVHQARNHHNLLRDLEGELHGMRYTDVLVHLLSRVVEDLKPKPRGTVLETMEEITNWLADVSFVPAQVVASLQAWFEDIKQITKGRP